MQHVANLFELPGAACRQVVLLGPRGSQVQSAAKSEVMVGAEREAHGTEIISTRWQTMAQTTVSLQ